MTALRTQKKANPMKTKAVTKFEPATPTYFSKEVVYRIAEKTADAVGYRPGGELIETVKAMGGVIKYQEIDEWMATDTGSIEVYGKGSFIIYLPQFTGPMRDRFTIAHELGHYVLHSKLGSKPIKIERRFGEDVKTRIEWEANWFSAAFLMPTRRFKAHFIRLKGDCAALAGIYMVSRSAIETRIKSLGLI